MRWPSTPSRAVLLALLGAAAVLIVVELAVGVLDNRPVTLGNPCRPRDGRTGGIDATVQRVVLDGLDGAACRLHTSREELVLSLGSGTGFRRRWDRRTIEAALRAGLLRAVDDAERRGDVPGVLAPVLRRLVRAAPLDLIGRGIRLRSLLG